MAANHLLKIRGDAAISKKTVPRSFRRIDTAIRIAILFATISILHDPGDFIMVCCFSKMMRCSKMFSNLYPLPGKQVAVNFHHFTPKTSHSCLKKWYTRFSRDFYLMN